MSQNIKIGIIGGAGFTGGELIRIILNHPQAELTFVQSNSQAGKPVWSAHSDLFGETDLQFVLNPDFEQVDVIFLTLAHGDSKKFLKENSLPKNLKIIDLSQDFRLKSTEHNFVYGLPELNAEIIRKAQYIANPGCFATAIQLALLPLFLQQDICNDLHISGITGSTGAGQKLSDSVHFSWRNNNISSYKELEHQHLNEINETLHVLQPNFAGDVNFIPFRGNFTRGILISAYTKCNYSENELQQMYANFYKNQPFIKIYQNEIDLKLVVNTNFAAMQIRKIGDKALITCAIDNLIKGASGQAVQNMNLMFGLDQTSGLKLKPSVF